MDREKEGLPRLVEGLQSHMWKHMTRKTDPMKGENAEAERQQPTQLSTERLEGVVEAEGYGE